MNTFRLKPRGRVGPILFPIEAINVPCSRPTSLRRFLRDSRGPFSVSLIRSASLLAAPGDGPARRERVSIIENPHFNALCQRGPHDELATAPFEIGRSQGQIHMRFGCPNSPLKIYFLHQPKCPIATCDDSPNGSNVPTKDSYTL